MNPGPALTGSVLRSTGGPPSPPRRTRLTVIEYKFDSSVVGTEIAQVIELSPMRHRDDVLAGEGLLPVLPALRDLLPGGGLYRGSVVT